MTLSYSKERNSLEKVCLAEVATLLSGSEWKRKQHSTFTKDADYFYVGWLNVYRNAARTMAVLEAKPLGIDEVLWDILRIDTNWNQPLSFHAWGAFTCRPIPLFEIELEAVGATDSVIAQGFVSFLRDAQHEARGLLDQRNFVDLLREHPNHATRGAYAITEVTTLIHQARYEEAESLAAEYDSGVRESNARMSSDGASFHQLALRWLAMRSEVH